MKLIDIEQQFHGYQRGHRLLESSCRLDRVDQDIITYLSDLSGPLEPSQIFSPYLTGYPTPSGEYYVLAKTWQDLDVRRSGCVFTRSFLVPMEDWLSIDYLSGLAGELGSDAKPKPSSNRYQYSDQPRLINRVEDSRATRIVRTIFLKEKMPVTCFGPADAEPIVFRLLQSDKSDLRRNLSFCTFSLAPRSIEGKALSLQFAPISCKSRFAQWSGQKIGNDFEGAEAQDEPELRALVRAIFLAEQPDIRSIDETGLFWNEENERPVPIKIVFLWNRMYREASGSASSLLGLLDISSTLGTLKPSALHLLKPLIKSWLDKWSSGSYDQRSVEILASLIAKIQNTDMQIWRDIELSLAVSSAVRQFPTSAVKTLSQGLKTTNWTFDIVMSSIGEALTTFNLAELESVLRNSLTDDQIFAMMINSYELLQPISDTHILDGAVVAEEFEAFLDRLNQSKAINIRQELLTKLWKDEHLPLLITLSSELDHRMLSEGILGLFGKERSVSAQFDQVILKNPIIESGLSKLLEDMLDTVQMSQSDRFIAAGIALQPQQFKLLSRLDQKSVPRLQSILAHLFRNHSDHELQKVFSLEENEIQSLEIASQLVGLETKIAVSVLQYIQHSSTRAAEVAFQCYTSALDDEIGEAAFQSIRFALQLDTPVANDILTTLGNISISRQQASTLSFVQKGYRPEMIERNLRYLSENWGSASHAFPFGGEQILSPLISYGLSEFSSDLWPHVGKILDRIPYSHQGQYEAWAGHLLGAALELPHSDVSGVLEIAFPIVHRALKRSRREPSFFSPFYYSDWDKCKVARTALVKAYMRSDWPVESLLKIAVKIDEAHSIFNIIHRERGGEEFTKRLVTSVEKLPPNLRRMLEAQSK